MSNLLTVITTYYDEPQFLRKFLDRHNKRSNYNIIIVDDASQKHPALDIVKEYNTEDLQLFRVTEDIGFNSHGARNLAMQHTKTDWNLLIDVDYSVEQIDKLITSIKLGDMDDSVPLFFPVVKRHEAFDPITPRFHYINLYAVTKQLFWKAGGYDSEFFGVHHGDKFFTDRMLSKDGLLFYYEGCHLREIDTSGLRTVVMTEWEGLREESDKEAGVFRISPAQQKRVNSQIKVATQRLKDNIPNTPITFKWEQLL